MFILFIATVLYNCNSFIKVVLNWWRKHFLQLFRNSIKTLPETIIGLFLVLFLILIWVTTYHPTSMVGPDSKPVEYTWFVTL